MSFFTGFYKNADFLVKSAFFQVKSSFLRSLRQYPSFSALYGLMESVILSIFLLVFANRPRRGRRPAAVVRPRKFVPFTLFQIFGGKTMRKKQKKYYLYIDGQAVPVTEQVYETYHHYARKEEYFSYDLKTEKFTCDQQAQTAAFTPSREDSLDRLWDTDRQFAAPGPSTEEQATSSVWMEELMKGLSQQEREIITQLYILNKSEREASAALHLAKSTFRRRKAALIEKLRNLLNENS